MVYCDFYHFSGSYRSINVKFVKVLILFSLLSAEFAFPCAILVWRVCTCYLLQQSNVVFKAGGMR